MQRRPRLLVILAIFLGVLALSLSFQAAWIYGYSSNEISATLNWLTVAGLLTCSVLCWRADPQLRYGLPALVFLVAANNYGMGASWLACVLGTLGFAGVTGFVFMHRTTGPVLRHPDLRWWQRAPRKQIHVPVVIEGTRLTSLRAETFDLSESGAFVPNIISAGIGDCIDLRLSCNSLRQIRCQGRVVRRGHAKGIYPAGIGIQFVDMPRRQRRELRRFLFRQTEMSP